MLVGIRSLIQPNRDRPSTDLRRVLVLLLTLFTLSSGSLLPVYAQTGDQSVEPGVDTNQVRTSDIDGHWAENAILLLRARGIIDDFGDTFFPDSPITRAEYAELFVRALGHDDSAQQLLSARAEPYFKDVNGLTPRWNYIEVAWELGLIEGYPGREFKPDLPVSRSEMVTMLVRALEWQDAVDRTSAEFENRSLTEDEFATTPAILDFYDLPDWAQSYVFVALRRGLFRGYPDNRFHPEDLTTRSQAAVLIHRLMKMTGRLWDVEGSFIRFLYPSEGSQLHSDTFEDRPGEISSYPVAVELRVRGEHVIIPVADSASFFVVADDTRLPIEISSDPRSVVSQLDWVSLMLDDAGEAIGFKSQPATLLGELVAIDTEEKLLAVELDGESSLKQLSGADWTQPSVSEPEGDPASAVPVPVVLRYAEDTVVFREGQLISAEELSYGDRVYAAFNPYSKVAIAIDAQDYSVYGRFVGINTETGMIEIRMADGSVHELVLHESAVVRRGGAETTVEDVPTGIQVLLALDEEGLVVQLDTPRAILPTPLETRTDPLKPDSSSQVAGPGRPLAASLVSAWNLVEAWESVYQSEDAAASMAVNSNAMGVTGLRDLTDASGDGITIAIIDTGVDPAHPDLTMTPGWHSKIIDWVDFSGEGDVDTSQTATEKYGRLATPYGDIRVGQIKSASNSFHYGFIWESDLSRGGVGGDLNGNGTPSDIFPVLVTDSTIPGYYDTVYVDTDSDLDFSDEMAMKPFQLNASVNWFSGSSPNYEGSYNGAGFVVTRVDPSGVGINLGFDGNGHGTHVAGNAAASGSYREGAVGVAPGARLIVAKALNSAGDGSWQNIERALTHSAQQGADIIVLSIATEDNFSGRESAQSQAISNISKRYGVLVVMAAGNTGPALGSVLSPGSSGSVLTVGGYMSPAMWDTYYGLQVHHEGVGYFSAVGPRNDGSLGATVLAPAATVSTVPQWYAASGYALQEGTSMAAPQVAGVAALLMQAAADNNIDVSAELVTRSIELGARPLTDHSHLVQGHGLVNAMASWGHLQQLADTGLFDVDVSVREAGVAVARGIRGDSQHTESVIIEFINRSEGTAHLLLESEEPWAEIDHSGLTLPRGIGRQVVVSRQGHVEPGLYSQLLTGDDARTYGPDVGVLMTLIEPHRFSEYNHWSLFFTDKLPAAKYRRYFLEVPEGSAGLNLRLGTGLGMDGQPNGRVRLHVVSPDGSVAEQSEFIGLGSVNGLTEFVREYKNPIPGVWEIIVYSAPSLSFYHQLDSLFQLDATVDGVFSSPDIWEVRLSPEPSQHGSERSTVSNRFILRNAYGDIAPEVIAFGLSPRPAYLHTKTAQTDRAGGYTGDLGYVDEDAGLLIVRMGDAADPRADLDMQLMWLNPVDAKWEEVAAAATEGSSEESMEVINPAPGHYSLVVNSYTGTQTAFRFSTATYRQGGQMAVELVLPQGEIEGEGPTETAEAQSGPDEVAEPTWYRGQSAALEVSAEGPELEGKYYGYVLIRDQITQKTVRSLPVILEYAPEGLIVTVSQGSPIEGRILDPDYTPELHVRVTVRDRGTFAPVATPVFINGLRHSSPHGEVETALPEGFESSSLSIEVRTGDYPRYSNEFVIMSQPESIPGSFVSSILQDHEGRIGWAGNLPGGTAGLLRTVETQWGLQSQLVSHLRQKWVSSP